MLNAPSLLVLHSIDVVIMELCINLCFIWDSKIDLSQLFVSARVWTHNLWLASSCQRLSFLIGICISLIDHNPQIGSHWPMGDLKVVTKVTPTVALKDSSAQILGSAWRRLSADRAALIQQMMLCSQKYWSLLIFEEPSNSLVGTTVVIYSPGGRHCTEVAFALAT